MRLIDAEMPNHVLIDFDDRPSCMCVLDEDIYDAPTVDAEPKRGEWVVNPNDGRPSGWKCNQCGFNGDSWDNFCRHCGADMRGKK